MIPQTANPLVFELKAGALAVYGQSLVVIEQLDGPQVCIRDLVTGKQSIAAVGEIRGRDSQRISALLDHRAERLRSADSTRVNAAQTREQALVALLSSPGAWRERLTAAAHQLGLSRRSIYRWLKRYRAAATISSLVKNYPGPRHGRTRLDKERESLLRGLIDEHYLKQPRLSAEAIYREAGYRCKAIGLKMIARGTVHSRLEALDPMVVAHKRHGAKYAREKIAPMPGKFDVQRALDVMQIDHTQIDVHVVDEQFRLPLGRPWISVATDVATRMVCGFYLTLESPSALSVALCVHNAVFPKQSWLAERDVKAEWPAWGLPKTIHTDNGSDFKGEALRRGCAEYGIALDFRPEGRAHFGGHIERLIGTLMKRVHTLPGTTYSNTVERGDYPSEEKASLTLAELERWLAIEICTLYHGSVHSSLDTAPLVAWEQAMKDCVRRALPQDPRRFVLGFLPCEDRIPQRDGLHLWHLRYWSELLPRLAKPHQPVLVRYDPRDISKIYVRQSSAGDYIEVPYADRRWPPISLFELEAARTALRRAGAERITAHQLFAAIESQREIVNQSLLRKKEARRALLRQPRFNEQSSNSLPSMENGVGPPVNYNVDPELLPTEIWTDRP